MHMEMKSNCKLTGQSFSFGSVRSFLSSSGLQSIESFDLCLFFVFRSLQLSTKQQAAK